MKPQRRQSTCLIALLIVALSYHAASIWGSRSSRKLNSPPPPSTVQTRVSAQFRSIKEPYSTPASKVIGGIGYALRYFAGQLPELVVKGDSSPYQYLGLTREIFSQYPRTSGQDNFGNIALVEELLGKAGITVFIIPVPGKISIERDRFPYPLPPPLPFGVDPSWRGGREDAYGVYSALLQKIGGRSIDLFHLFNWAKRTDPSSPLYPPSDFHWSSRAISLTTQALLQRLSSYGFAVPPTEITLAGSIPRTRPLQPFHIVHHLQLPPWILSHLPQFQWKEPVYRLKISGSVPHKRTAIPRRVILAGTSNCLRHDGTPYSLGSLLSETLGRPIQNYCVAGGSSTGWIRSMTNQHFTFQPGDLFLWEVTITETWDLNGSYERINSLIAPLLPRLRPQFALADTARRRF